MPNPFRDAYPYPTDGEPTRAIQLSPRDDEPWDSRTWPDVPSVEDDDPSRPTIAIHSHHLCGHDCLSGACSGMEAICLSCEFKLQDSRTRHNSRGMNQP